MTSAVEDTAAVALFRRLLNRAAAFTGGASSATAGEPHRSPAVCGEVVLVPEEARAREDACVRLLDEVLGLLARAAKPPGCL